MSCRTIRAELVAALYGDLAPADRRAVEAHLATCPDCAAERDALARMLDAITPEAVFPREGEVDWEVPVTCLRVRAELRDGRIDLISEGARPETESGGA